MKRSDDEDLLKIVLVMNLFSYCEMGLFQRLLLIRNKVFNIEICYIIFVIHFFNFACFALFWMVCITVFDKI